MCASFKSKEIFEMSFVIKVMGDNETGICADIQTLNDKINLVLALKRVDPCGFLKAEKSHIV